MRFYHRTNARAAAKILEAGFRNARGTYMTNRGFTGVWLSNRPLDENEGPGGDALLQIDLALDEAAIADFEWTEKGKPYREWLVPAHLVNKHGTIALTGSADSGKRATPTRERRRALTTT